MIDSGETSSSSSAAKCFMTSLNTSNATCVMSKRKKGKNKRRFSDDQIRSLETMFETETKLEPKKKLQLARELGLLPRQVAIWFQNKRARWKSKQLERDYSLLRSNYNNLSSQFESLKKEKQSLLLQLQKLNDLTDKSEKERRELCDCRHEASDAEPGNSIGPGVESINNGTANFDSCTETLIDVKPNPCLERSKYGIVGDEVLSDDGDNESSRANPDYLGLEEEAPELLNIVEPADSSLTSPGGWSSLNSSSLLVNQPSSSYQWWDFWS